MRFIIKILITTLSVLVSAYIIPGVYVNSFFTALTVAVVLGFLNIFLKPIMIVLTIPVTIFTLGLFLLVINASIILITDALIYGFEVNSFWSALLFSLVLTIVNSLFENIRRADDKENNNED
jgi:putative membrane protein